MASLGLLFAIAGVRKFFYLRDFRRTLLLIPHLPMWFAWPAAVLVPAAEIVGGIGMLAGLQWASALVLGLLLATTLVAAIAIAKKQRVPCACFTSSGTEYLSLATVTRNLVLAVVAVLPYLVPTAPPEPLVIANGIAVVLLYLAIDSAASNAVAIKNIGRPS